VDEIAAEYPAHLMALVLDLTRAMAAEELKECVRLLADVSPEDLRNACMLLAFGVAKKMKDASSPLTWTDNSVN